MEQQQAARRRYIGKQRPRPSEFVIVCQPVAAQQLVPVSSSLVAEPHQPKRKRTQTGIRVQFVGQRPNFLQASSHFGSRLKAQVKWTSLRSGLPPPHPPTSLLLRAVGPSFRRHLIPVASFHRPAFRRHRQCHLPKRCGPDRARGRLLSTTLGCLSFILIELSGPATTRSYWPAVGGDAWPAQPLGRRQSDRAA